MPQVTVTVPASDDFGRVHWKSALSNEREQARLNPARLVARKIADNLFANHDCHGVWVVFVVRLRDEERHACDVGAFICTPAGLPLQGVLVVRLADHVESTKLRRYVEGRELRNFGTSHLGGRARCEKADGKENSTHEREEARVSRDAEPEEAHAKHNQHQFLHVDRMPRVSGIRQMLPVQTD